MGESTNGYGVFGENSGSGALGLLGGTDRVFSQNAGVYGESTQQGVFGNSTSANGTGIYGIAAGGAGHGVRGDSKDGIAVQGQSFGNGVGILGKGGRVAGRFEGNVEVTGDLCLVNQDCAEDFDIWGAEDVEPGTVMVLETQGAVKTSASSYDKRVAGVICGAGDFQPGIILGKQQTAQKRLPIALLGKVYCKVDASSSRIEVGDLLTTSDTPGHAMKATDPAKSLGAVIGKALCSLADGRGLIPILVALQ